MSDTTIRPNIDRAMQSLVKKADAIGSAQETWLDTVANTWAKLGAQGPSDQELKDAFAKHGESFATKKLKSEALAVSPHRIVANWKKIKDNATKARSKASDKLGSTNVKTNRDTILAVVRFMNKEKTEAVPTIALISTEIAPKAASKAKPRAAMVDALAGAVVSTLRKELKAHADPDAGTDDYRKQCDLLAESMAAKHKDQHAAIVANVRAALMECAFVKNTTNIVPETVAETADEDDEAPNLLAQFLS